MSAITLAEAQQQLADWLAASKAIAGSQQYRIGGIGGHMVTRTDAAEVRQQINYWSAMVNTLTNAANSLPTTPFSVSSFT